MLKWLLWTYGAAVGISPNWKSHDLLTLWSQFEKIEGTDDVVAECIREFSEMDKTSFNFRYAMKSDGTPIVLNKDRLDLQRLRDVMGAIDGYFSGCDGYLDHLQGA